MLKIYAIRLISSYVAKHGAITYFVQHRLNWFLKNFDLRNFNHALLKKVKFGLNKQLSLNPEVTAISSTALRRKGTLLFHFLNILVGTSTILVHPQREGKSSVKSICGTINRKTATSNYRRRVKIHCRNFSILTKQPFYPVPRSYQQFVDLR